MQKVIGWLFGLRASPDAHLSIANVTIRKMSDEEKHRIVHSLDFLEPRIRLGHVEGFPLVFEKVTPDECPIGGDDSISILLSLLAPGEVRTPVVWSIHEGGRSGGGASNSQIMDCHYRLINSRFQIIEFEMVRDSAVIAFERLQSFTSFSPYLHLDSVLLDRLFESKQHPLKKNAPDHDIISRAADICIALESLYAPGTGEIQFKLAISMAWLLERDVSKRADLMTAVKHTYALRSKLVHGDHGTKRALNSKVIENVMCVDRLLRRSILIHLLNDLDEGQWKKTYTDAIVGLPIGLDTAEWVQG